jgi:hypothetical protein
MKMDYKDYLVPVRGISLWRWGTVVEEGVEIAIRLRFPDLHLTRRRWRRHHWERLMVMQAKPSVITAGRVTIIVSIIVRRRGRYADSRQVSRVAILSMSSISCATQVRWVVVVAVGGRGRWVMMYSWCCSGSRVGNNGNGLPVSTSKVRYSGL